MKKNILMLGAALALMAFDANAVEPQSGTTGEVNWSVDANGVLTISGNGSMANYTYTSGNNKNNTGSTAPWYGIKDQITSVVVEQGVTSVGNYAFRDLTNATSLSFPSSGLTSIGTTAFENNSSLTSVTIPNSVTTVGEAAFKNASKLQYLTISDGLSNIAIHTFENAYKLEKLKIPENVTKIEEGAFSRATSLTTIDFGGVKEIGNKAFAYNYDLKELVIPYPVEKIGGNTFKDATSLTTLVIGDSVQTLGTNAFLGTTSLTSVTIGKSLKSVPGDCFSNNNCFSGASKLKELTIDPTNPNLSVIANFFKGRSPAITKINCIGADRSVCDAAMLDAGWDISAIPGEGNAVMPTGAKLTNEDIQDPSARPQQTAALTNTDLFDRSKDGRVDKRIYTVNEANLVSGRRNKLMIRYR